MTRATPRRISRAGLAIAIVVLLGASSWQAQRVECRSRASTDTIKPVLYDPHAPAKWDSATRATVRRHEACVGMTKDMLVQSWGLPYLQRWRVPAGAGDTTAEYSYHAATVIVINDAVKAFRPAGTPVHQPR